MLAGIMRKLRPRTRWQRFRAWVAVLGLVPTLKHQIFRRFSAKQGTEYKLYPRKTLYPLIIRSGSSDIDVFSQIFVEREYGCLDDMQDVHLVVDCGANAGFSSAYFLSQFPNCRVVAVEPDPNNFAMLQRNLASYGDRVMLVRAGVWSHTTPLVVSTETYRDGREWAKQVRPCGPNEKADLEGIDVGTLLARTDCDRISLLKMDVEGAEAVIFTESCQSWLDKVDTIAIELHDDSAFGDATSIFFAAIRGRGFQISTSGELTVCRPSPTPSV